MLSASTLTTIKDIAKKANVSTGTVDRVIHNRPGVSKKTKVHVEKIIKEHNFQINTIASTLALNKNYKIGVLIPQSKSENEFWSEPKRGIEKATEEIKNFRISTTFHLFNQFDASSYVWAFKKLIEGDFDAALIAPVFHKETTELIKHLDKKRTPYIFINIDLTGFNALSFIGQDSFKSGNLAAKLMSIMLTDSSQILIPIFRLNKGNYSHINHRISGFKSYFEEIKSNVQIKEVTIPNFKNLNTTSSILHEQLRDKKTEGVFVPSSRTHLIAEYIENSELKNIKLIGYDTNKKNIRFVKKGIIDFSICQNPFDQGFKGIKLLSEFLLLNKQPNQYYHSALTIVTKENIDAY